jgi:membrane-bound lytic murein transglycosylase B
MGTYRGFRRASPPPRLRTAALLAGGIVVAVLAVFVMRERHQPAPVLAGPPPFDVWRAALVAEALDRGFDRQLVDSAVAGLEPLPHVVESDRAQAEVAQPLDDYLSARVTPELVAMGRELMQRHRSLLTRIEQRFGVPGRFLVAIWGAETGYGRYTGDVPVLRALATLAWHPRRAEYFRGELFDALRMIQNGYIERQQMVGSWAGAMGQPQFMPSSYLEYAVDFDGDRRRDIWRSEADTLASIANYLQAFGWRSGVTWGREVDTAALAGGPAGAAVEPRSEGCQAIRSLTGRRPLRDWKTLGVRRLDGSHLPHAAVEASLLTLDGRAFLVYRNYEAILGYNCAHRYALSVAMLADGLRRDVHPPLSFVKPVLHSG